MARDSMSTRSTRARQPPRGRGGGTWVWIAASMAVLVISAVTYWFWKRRQDLRETTPKPPKDPKPPVEEDPDEPVEEDPDEPVEEDPVEEDPVKEDPVEEDPVEEDPDNPVEQQPDDPPQDDRYRTCATPYQTLNADGRTCTATCLDEYGQIQPKLANGSCPLVLGRASDALVQAQQPLTCPSDSQPSQQYVGLCEKVKYYANSPPIRIYRGSETCRDGQWKMAKSYTVISEDTQKPVEVKRDVCVTCAPDAVQDVDHPQQCRPVVCPPNTQWDEAKRGCQPNDQFKAIVTQKPPVVCPYGSYETKDGRCYAYCRDAKNQLQPHQTMTIQDGRSIDVCPSIGLNQVTADPLCPIGSRLFGELCIPQYVNKV